jgi:hypothetical protein
MHCLLFVVLRAALTSRLATTCAAWFGRLITRALARQLQLPEALVHDGCLYLYSCVDLFERRLMRGLLGRRS